MDVSFKRFEMIAGFVGLGVPVMFRIIWSILDWLRWSDFELQVVLQRIMLMFWPTGILATVSSDVPGFETKLFLFAMSCNAIVYLALGALIWLGLRKNVVFIAFAVLVVGILWWRVLAL